MRPNPPYSGMCLFTNRHRRLYMATKKSFPFGPDDMASGAVPLSDAVKESAKTRKAPAARTAKAAGKTAGKPTPPTPAKKAAPRARKPAAK